VVNPGDIMVKFTAPADRVIYSGKRVTERVTEKESEVLNLIIEDPSYTTKELAEKLSLSRKTISDRIKSLKNKGIIRRIGSDTKGHWEIIEDEK
jgi:ATP-dependent DNA helicase RecG